jgi:putative effector of murein hydrolase LrgA (UPF0299 family)
MKEITLDLLKFFGFMFLFVNILNGTWSDFFQSELNEIGVGIISVVGMGIYFISFTNEIIKHKWIKQ